MIIAKKILLSHEPLNVDWALNIHGHDHSGTEYENGLNLVPNIFGYFPLNLQQVIDKGLLKNIKSIHRQIIDAAIERKKMINNEQYMDNI